MSDDPDIAGKTLGEQFEKLLLQPHLSLKQTSDTIPSIIIVIDALDECDDNYDIRVILELLSRFGGVKAVRLRIFLTSRPGLPLSRAFSKVAAQEYEDLILHEIPEVVTEHDISLLLNHRLSEIRKNRSLPANWPGDIDIRNLITLSVPLFIFAATVCRMLEDDSWDPVDSLTEILAHRHTESKLALTYLPVLQHCLKDKSEKQEKQMVQEFKQIVGAIVSLEHPLSTISLSKFLGLSGKLINLRLNQLHSILRIPEDENKPVWLFHLPFQDFILREQTQFWVDEEDMHQRLALRCFLVFNSLKRNICRLPDDGTSRAGISRQTIDNCIPPELQYSCRYWAYHLTRSKDRNSVSYDAFLFLQKHFLHWVEAMSILGFTSEIVGMIDQLYQWLPRNGLDQLPEFLEDARRFILKNRQMVDEIPLQIYSSGLAFAPKTALIGKLFEHELPTRIWRLPDVEESWSAEIQTLESHSGRVLSVAFSPDGQFLVSGSDDSTLKLRDTASGSGILCKILHGHLDWVRSVAFSPNGEFLASGSDDNTVKIWDMPLGVLRHTLNGHSNRVLSVAFSSDNCILASGSVDRTVKLWDIATYTVYLTLEGHLGWVTSVAFSSGSHFLASGSIDRSVKLWDITQGHSNLNQTFQGHTGPVRFVALSLNGQYLVPGSDDNMVKLWDLARNTFHHDFKGHSGPVRSVVFSSGGEILVSGSNDRSIKLWDIATNTHHRTLKGHSDPVRSVALSLKGHILAFGSIGNTVKLWDIATNALYSTLEGHSDWVRSVAFSLDSQIVASGSIDNTVKLWDTVTGALHQTIQGSIESVSSAGYGSFMSTNLESVHNSCFSDSSIPNLSRGNVEIAILGNRWVTLNSEKVLWLPPEYRPTCVAMKYNVLALGHASGRISFIGFCA
ncbi:hypothetical protein N7540_000158 [Penicillium herquei]|nr:hypothetical protein N7540_000158 [Penicillium herquei]